jgi:hypothetical protein
MNAPDVDLETLYSEHFPSLVRIAITKRVPIEEAEQLAHDVLMSSLFQFHRIGDLEAWLTGALTCAIRRNQRS